MSKNSIVESYVFCFSFVRIRKNVNAVHVTEFQINDTKS